MPGPPNEIHQAGTTLTEESNRNRPDSPSRVGPDHRPGRPRPRIHDAHGGGRARRSERPTLEPKSMRIIERAVQKNRVAHTVRVSAQGMATIREGTAERAPYTRCRERAEGDSGHKRLEEAEKKKGCPQSDAR
ncbi:unnamed protein product [Calypogeia fissa]